MPQARPAAGSAPAAAPAVTAAARRTPPRARRRPSSPSPRTTRCARSRAGGEAHGGRVGQGDAGDRRVEPLEPQDREDGPHRRPAEPAPLERPVHVDGRLGRPVVGGTIPEPARVGKAAHHAPQLDHDPRRPHDRPRDPVCDLRPVRRHQLERDRGPNDVRCVDGGAGGTVVRRREADVHRRHDRGLRSGAGRPWSQLAGRCGRAGRATPEHGRIVLRRPAPDP